MTITDAATAPHTAVAHQTRNHRIPAWARVWAWAVANADPITGHAPCYPGELRRALGDTTAREISRAIRLAKDRRLLDPCSTAGCLVLPGHALAPCPAQHRGGT